MLLVTVPVVRKEVNIKIRQQPLSEEREALRFILKDQIPIFYEFLLWTHAWHITLPAAGKSLSSYFHQGNGHNARAGASAKRQH